MTGADATMSSDRLNRFLQAQAEVFETALGEIRAGRKRTHWMWFVFPQLTGLGRSPTAAYYGLAGLDEARAYLDHPVLGDRLRDCVTALLQNRGKTASGIFGFPDDAKLRSCLTLFEAAASVDGGRDLFRAAIEQFFGGTRDRVTLAMVGLGGDAPDRDAIERLGAVRDPSPAQIATMIRSSSARAARRIVCERSGTVWCWPAERATHAEGARIVGATWTQPPNAEILTLGD